MTFYSRPTGTFEEYLIRLIFGSKVDSDSLSVCAKMAYLDFNRTLHGISKIQNGAKLYTDAIEFLMNSMEQLKESLTKPTSQRRFDEWHAETCSKMILMYQSSHTLYAGQAQKWINMTLKYVYTLGPERIAGFEKAYSYCHAPLDKIVIGQLAKYHFPRLTCAWSRLNYPEYFERQEWLRSKFILVPLDLEFLLWLGKPIKPEYFRPH